MKYFGNISNKYRFYSINLYESYALSIHFGWPGMEVFSLFAQSAGAVEYTDCFSAEG